jgi:hypothetical protein
VVVIYRGIIVSFALVIVYIGCPGDELVLSRSKQMQFFFLEFECRYISFLVMPHKVNIFEPSIVDIHYQKIKRHVKDITLHDIFI